MRDLEKQMADENISYSRMVEILNEQMENHVESFDKWKYSNLWEEHLDDNNELFYTDNNWEWKTFKELYQIFKADPIADLSVTLKNLFNQSTLALPEILQISKHLIQ